MMFFIKQIAARLKPLRHKNLGEGSVVFGISQAVEKLRFGSSDDEATALLANKIVRACLDKRAITFEDYRAWRRKNRLVFTTVVDEEGELIGFLDIFPLTASAGRAILSGELNERSLSIEHVLSFDSNENASFVHIATILVNPLQRSLPSFVAREAMLLMMANFIERNFRPLNARTFTAFGQSKEGKAILNRCGFSVALLANESEHQCPLYVLKAGEAGRAIDRFNRITTQLAPQWKRESRVSEVDERISRIEIELRCLIIQSSNNDLSRLPSHLLKKADERLRAAFKREPHERHRDASIGSTLEFFDLRELQDAIASKSLWPVVEEHFSTKELLNTRFGQLSELRNCLRHVRSISDIVFMEGEAAILWFEGTLKSALEPRRASSS